MIVCAWLGLRGLALGFDERIGGLEKLTDTF
jgi:hypothetical protein